MSRFSKATLTEAIQRRLETIQRDFGFDPGNGTAQLHGNKKDVKAAVAYGEREAMLELADLFDLPISGDV